MGSAPKSPLIVRPREAYGTTTGWVSPGRAVSIGLHIVWWGIKAYVKRQSRIRLYIEFGSTEK